ncbi:hypothetical protein MVEN_01999200 [Mycena venus]|uniref:F-box domain-containing protein n=1 Tax=Mycena venus TaxID=2733690 RepID=A0A8H6XDQ5_9AGAR|nr:hypothetical protein MVEN_01999200 [Mycena venus]
MDSSPPVESTSSGGRQVLSRPPSCRPPPYPDIIPIELWLLCWSLCSRPQLRRLSMVCRLFRDICLSLLFEQQTIDSAGLWSSVNRHNWIDLLHRMHRAAVRLNTLCESPHIRLVRSWKFLAYPSIWPRSPTLRDVQNFSLFSSTHSRVLSAFSSTLSRYHNLQALHLQGLTIDPPFRESLALLPRLDDLTLSFCDIIARSGSIFRLTRFSISGPEIGTESVKHWEPLQIVSPEGVHMLYLHAPHEIKPLIAGFGYAQFPNLVVLSLALHNPSDVDGFISVLKRCPRLESLAIPQLECTLIPMLLSYGLHPDTIPLLRDLSGRPEVFPFFASNRPITAAAILMAFRGTDMEPAVSTADVLRAFNALLNSSTALVSLSIREFPLSPELLGAIAMSFPQLQKLSIFLQTLKPTRNYGLHRPRCRTRRSHVDVRYPILRDADAFRSVSEEALSDAEQDAPPIELIQAPIKQEIPAYSELHMIFNCISSGNTSLPPDIEIFRVRQDEQRSILTQAMQHVAIANLGQLYPRLREVQMGNVKSLWERDGAVWRNREASSCVRVV